MCFPWGDKTHILPSPLILGLREHYGWHCMPCRGCCRKRAYFHGAGPAWVPLSLLANPLHIFQQQACPAPKWLSRSAGMLASKGLTPCTHTQLRNQISTWGMWVTGGQTSGQRPSPSPDSSSTRVPGGDSRKAGFPALPSMLCSPCSSHQPHQMLQQPAGSLPGSCATGFQQFFPASRGPFCYMAFLYGVPGRQPAPLPSHGDFPRWALQATSVLGPGNWASAGRNLLVSGLN